MQIPIRNQIHRPGVIERPLSPPRVLTPGEEEYCESRRYNSHAVENSQMIRRQVTVIVDNRQAASFPRTLPGDDRVYRMAERVSGNPPPGRGRMVRQVTHSGRVEDRSHEPRRLADRSTGNPHHLGSNANQQPIFDQVIQLIASDSPIPQLMAAHDSVLDFGQPPNGLSCSHPDERASSRGCTPPPCPSRAPISAPRPRSVRENGFRDPLSRWR